MSYRFFLPGLDIVTSEWSVFSSIRVDSKCGCSVHLYSDYGNNNDLKLESRHPITAIHQTITQDQVPLTKDLNLS